MKKEKGITLIALTITVIVLLILASVSTYSGISTIKSSKQNKFKQELEIMQAQVQILYEKYSKEIEEGKEIEIGEELTNSEQENNAFQGANETDKIGYRLFTEDTIKKLGIDGIKREYLVNIAKKQVISMEPFINDKTAYYTLSQLSEKNVIDTGIERGDVEFSLQTNPTEQGVEVKISNIEYSKYVGKGSILYQKAGSTTWKTLVSDYKKEEYSFTLSEVGEYNVKIVDAAGKEKISDTPIIVQAIGNYLLDETTYFETLVEAVAAAKDGSTIKVIKDTEETEAVTINKSLTLDTNEKTIKYTVGNKIIISEEKNVVLMGNGLIYGEINASEFIVNYGKLEANKVKIESNYKYGLLQATIVVFENGEFTSNDSDISAISCSGNNSNIIINGGKYNSIGTYQTGISGTIIINNAEVEVLNFINGGICTINSGKIERIDLSSSGGDINLTIGNINDTVNTNNPQIGNIDITSFDLAGITAIINFYNGIIKECFFNLEDETGLESSNHPYEFEYNLRPGYKAQTTTEGTILVVE